MVLNRYCSDCSLYNSPRGMPTAIDSSSIVNGLHTQMQHIQFPVVSLNLQNHQYEPGAC